MKKNTILVFVFVAIVSGFMTNSFASDFYVSLSGNNNNVGSESYPWQTIQYGVNQLQPGDTLYIRQGIYNEQRIDINTSGAENSPIIIKSYPGEAAAIDSQNAGTSWTGIINMDEASYITLENLEIRNAGADRWGVYIDSFNVNNPSQYIELRNLYVHHTGAECIEIKGYTSYVLVEDCTVSNGGNLGVDIYKKNDEGRPHHVTVRGCTVHSISQGVGAGIGSERADNLIIENNETYNCGLGIDIGSGDNNIIRNNTVYNCDTGIALSSNEDSEVYNNTIHDIAEEAIYCYYWSANGEGHARNKWYDNVIYNADVGIYESNQKGSSGGVGPTSHHEYYRNLFYDIGAGWRTPLYFKGTTDLKFYHNTVVIRNGYPAMRLFDGAINADIRNNIFSISGSVSPIIGEDYANVLVSDYNCYFNRSGTVTTSEPHSIVENPLFVDALNGDFHLQSNSLCLDSGVDLGLPYTEELPADMGAFSGSSACNRILWSR